MFYGSFHFLNALQSDNSSNTVYALGHVNTFWALTAHFKPPLMARAKISQNLAK